MAKKRITISSKREQEIERAYVQTPAGKVMFTLTLVACVALLVGLLIETYKVSAWGTEFINPDSLIYAYSNYLFMWGSFAALICMVFYIKFAVDYKTKNGTVKTTKTIKKPATKKVVKKTEPAKKEESKPAKKPAVKKTVKSTTKTTTKTTTKKTK